MIDWEDSFEEYLPLYDLFNFSLLTCASLKIGIKGRALYKKFKSDMPYYRLFLKKAGLKNDENEVLYWLKVYLERIISNQQFWNRWGEGEKRPLIIKTSLEELLKIV